MPYIHVTVLLQEQALNLPPEIRESHRGMVEVTRSHRVAHGRLGSQPAALRTKATQRTSPKGVLAPVRHSVGGTESLSAGGWAVLVTRCP